jgi:hypothetical protein
MPTIVEELRALATDLKESVGEGRHESTTRALVLIGDGGGKVALAKAFTAELGVEYHEISGHRIAAAPIAEQCIAELLKPIMTREGAEGEKLTQVIHFRDTHLLFEPRGEDSQHYLPRPAFHAVVAAIEDLVAKSTGRPFIVVSADFDSAALPPTIFTASDHIIDVRRPSSVPERLMAISQFVTTLQSDSIAAPSKKELDYFARMTAGLSSEELKQLVEGAFSIARRTKAESLTLAHLVERFERQGRGIANQSGPGDEDQSRIEKHEDGHGIVADFCGVRPLLISSASRGRTGGCVLPDPSALGERFHTKGQGLKSMLICLGGLAAERKLLGDLEVSEGSMRDLQQLRSTVQRMVAAGFFIDELSGARSEGSMPGGHSELIWKLIRGARSTAERLVELAGKDTFQKADETRRSAGGTIFGEGAENFYRAIVPASKYADAEKLIKRFLSNPFAEVGSGSTRAD